MSSLIDKAEMNVELNAPADKFYDVFCCSPNNVSYACPDKVHSCSLLEGEWGKNGSIIYWICFDQDGQATVSKEVMEGIDRKNCRATYRLIEGDLLKAYKSFIMKLQVTPKSQAGEGSIARWIVEYGKLHEAVASPNAIMELLKEISKGCDAHLLQAN